MLLRNTDKLVNMKQGNKTQLKRMSITAPGEGDSVTTIWLFKLCACTILIKIKLH